MSKLHTRSGNGSREPILVVSTCTRDRVPLGNGTSKTVPGGPAHYMAIALERLGAPYAVLTGDEVDVQVVHTAEGEAYIIPHIRRIPMPPALTGSAVVLSPIIQEIDPRGVPPVQGLLIVDIQGFVRMPNVPSNAPTGPYNLTELIKRSDLVKASVEELALLDAESHDALESVPHLITGGKRGARIVRQGRHYPIAVNPVDAEHTIGAGDSFLAALAWAMVRGQEIEPAADEAARFTEAVLRERLQAPEISRIRGVE